MYPLHSTERHEPRNRHGSVYTRLWCAYEAYVASEAGKVIIIAKASSRRQLRRALCYWVA